MWQSGEWLDAHSRRHRQLARDEAELERYIKALPGPITGNALADVMLKRWAPDVVGLGCAVTLMRWSATGARLGKRREA